MVEAEALAGTATDTTTEWVELLRRHVVEEPCHNWHDNWHNVQFVSIDFTDLGRSWLLE